MFLPDRIYVLSLASRPDRFARLSRCHAASCLRDIPLRRWPAPTPDDLLIPDWWSDYSPSYYATNRGMMAMIENAYVAGCKTAIFFQDDALLLQNFDQDYIESMPELPRDWHALVLGSNWNDLLDDRSPIVSPHLRRVNQGTATHAYMLTRAGMHRLWSHTTHQIRKPDDHSFSELARMEGRFYAPRENLAIQWGSREAADGNIPDVPFQTLKILGES